jgi:hypothetical protein
VLRTGDSQRGWRLNGVASERENGWGRDDVRVAFRVQVKQGARLMGVVKRGKWLKELLEILF